MPQTPQFKNFDEFWPFYLGEHSNAFNRRLHVFGTGAGLLIVVMAVVLRNPILLPLSLVAGYGFAWIGHFFVEKNRPASFKHPVWSFMGDFKMLGLFLTGRLGGELQRLEIHR